MFGRSLQKPTENIPAPALPSHASAANSSTPSANGHFVSTARWNRHYLLPTAPPAGASSSSLNASTPVAAFTPPDWVFVTAEKGPDVLSSPTTDGAGKVTVTGRYAYAIYDEGGLLDANHTGYPSTSTPSHIGGKPVPSYADLTQIPMAAAAQTFLTTANVDNLLGWRNYATLQSTSSFPNLQPSTSSEAAYYGLFTANVANPTVTTAGLAQVPPTTWNNATDQMFLSRQQLIDYFTAAKLDPGYLQYLGTFSRSLNQPSYVQEHSAVALDPPIRPAVLSSSAGGNDAGDDSTNPSTNITPKFPLTRVINTFTRFDSTKAVPGEPLIKKRFPLDRLAWLTYKGPSSSRNTSASATSGPDGDIGVLRNNGITKEWLDQGTPKNIQTYFGLQWTPPSAPTPGYWTYVHGSLGNSGSILNVNNPNKTVDVARLTGTNAREPDFFELLKASINPGSIAKSSLSASVNPPNDADALGAQYQRSADISLDAAILQIGANIIDQFDADSFPTQINYNLGNSKLPGVVYGVENLPYISRLRSGLIRLVEADPPENLSSSVTDTMSFKNTGVAALMYYPELWNPHDWSSNSVNLTESLGAVGPQNFTVYAQTTSYGTQQSDFLYAKGVKPSINPSDVPGTTQYPSYNANGATSPGFSSVYGFPFSNATNSGGGENRTLSMKNTQMTFVLPTTSLGSGTAFREPTILFQPGVPTNIQLTSPALTYSSAASNGLGDLSATQQFFAPAPGSGLRSAVSGVIAAPQSASPYTTIPLPQAILTLASTSGRNPLRWLDSSVTATIDPKNPKGFLAKGSYVADQTYYGPVNDLTFILACDDGNGGMITYDTKTLSTEGQPNGKLESEADTCFGLNGVTGPGGAQLDYGMRYFETVDPRSARFGLLDSWVQQDTHSIPPKQYTEFSNYQTADNSLFTRRETADPGDAMYDAFGAAPYSVGDWFSTSMGWYRAGAPDSMYYWCYPGLLSQNLPIAASGTPTFNYSDADGVIRRASGGNAQSSSSNPNTGLPMAGAKGTTNAAYSSAGSPNIPSRQMDSRPVILNRPFRSVAELGYVYSGTPWKNLDFFMPESGDGALLDVFCVNDNSDTNGLTAGQVNLNTHQVPVLQAILAGTTKDLWNDATALAGKPPATIVGSPNATTAQSIAQLLVTRTTQSPTSGPNVNKGPQPLQNVSDLVGRWVSPMNAPSGGINGMASCDGFTGDLTAFTTADTVLSSTQRFAESAIRSLANAGQTRVWNLMFDIVAQTGRFPNQASSLDKFNVEGEQHYWVHVAIDRYTGQILDKQVEEVRGMKLLTLFYIAFAVTILGQGADAQTSASPTPRPAPPSEPLLKPAPEYAAWAIVRQSVPGFGRPASGRGHQSRCHRQQARQPDHRDEDRPGAPSGNDHESPREGGCLV